MKRLALLWILCATTGFVVAAAIAVGLALAIDGGGHSAPRAVDAATSAKRQPSHLGVAAPLYQGRRLLGD